MRDDSVVGCLDRSRQEEFYRALLDLQIPPQQARQERISLPAFLPLITDAMPEIPESVLDRIYAISMETLLGENGDLCVKSAEHLRTKLGLPTSARVALIGTVQDPKLERFWTSSSERDIWLRIADLDFEFVTSCTFSVWYDHPRFDQMYNQDRNLLTHDLMSYLGVPSIPFIMFSGDPMDYEANITWLRERPDVRIVALRGQNRRREYEFNELLDEMSALSSDVARPLHFLVVGVSKEYRIARILGRFNSTIVSAKPFLAANAGRRASRNLVFTKAPRPRQRNTLSLFEEDREISTQEIFSHNLAQYEECCDRWNNAKHRALRRSTVQT